MKSRVSVVLATFVLAVVVLFAPSRVAAAGVLRPPVETPAGAFGGIAYVEYNGIFEGQTSTGAYHVPYQIIAPQDRNRGNRTVLVEPPHVAVGLVVARHQFGPGLPFHPRLRPCRRRLEHIRESHPRSRGARRIYQRRVP